MLVVGDIIGLELSSSVGVADGLGSGIVTRVSKTSVTVAFDESVDIFSLESGLHDYYKITKLANDVTYKRLKRSVAPCAWYFLPLKILNLFLIKI